MKYQVRDNNKPAMHPYCNVDKSWGNCEFDTLEEAIAYIHEWLGEEFSPGIPELTNIFKTGNESYEYYSGDGISIKKIYEHEVQGIDDVADISVQRILHALVLLDYLECRIEECGYELDVVKIVDMVKKMKSAKEECK